jgi:hypothetical protein
VDCGGEVIVRPCRNWPAKGAESPTPGEPGPCVAHGGGTPQARAKHARHIAHASAARSLREVSVEPLGDPFDELADLAAELRTLKQHYANLAAEGDPQTIEGAARHKLYTECLNDAVRALRECARLGIEGRRTDALVAQGQLIALAVQGSMSVLFARMAETLAAAGVDRALIEPAAARLQLEVGPVVRQQMVEVNGTGDERRTA